MRQLCADSVPREDRGLVERVERLTEHGMAGETNSEPWECDDRPAKQ
jgi:hypothetical protein